MTFLPDRPARAAALFAACLVLAGLVVMIAAADPKVFVLGGGLLALGALVVMSLAFYAVGVSEDRERAARRDPRP